MNTDTGSKVRQHGKATEMLFAIAGNTWSGYLITMDL